MLFLLVVERIFYAFDLVFFMPFTAINTMFPYWRYRCFNGFFLSVWNVFPLRTAAIPPFLYNGFGSSLRGLSDVNTTLSLWAQALPPLPSFGLSCRRLASTVMTFFASLIFTVPYIEQCVGRMRIVYDANDLFPEK